MLDGKRILITGVATPDSIAFATARAVLELGGRVVLTAFPRDLGAARDLAKTLDPHIPVLALDLCDVARLEEVGREVGARFNGLDFDAGDRAWPVYNWMGVCKAALRATSRYLARDLGPSQIRVNLVAAGPLTTRAGSAIPGFEQLVDAWDTTAPLRWCTTDARPVADTACFLLSDLARSITGEVVHVDGGYHAMAAALSAGDAASERTLVDVGGDAR